MTGVPLGKLAAAAFELFAGATDPELEKLQKRCAEVSKALNGRKSFNQPELQLAGYQMAA
jgi:hypothetical protein